MGDYLSDIDDITHTCLDHLQKRADQMIEVLDPKNQSGIKILLVLLSHKAAVCSGVLD
jgi:chorismate mutase